MIFSPLRPLITPSIFVLSAKAMMLDIATNVINMITEDILCVSVRVMT
jgi:hypothetical protein